MIEYKLEDLPDELAPGTYAVRVKNAQWVDSKIEITLQFVGDVNPSDPTLYTITKHNETIGVE